MTSTPEPVRAVVALFEGPLASVRFGDVDRAGLTTLVEQVSVAAEELARQEAKVEELRHALAERQEALLGLAQQALAYARIYAEADESLLARLNEIALPRAGKPRKPAGKAKPATEAARDSAEAPLESVAEAPLESVAEAPLESVSEPEVAVPARTVQLESSEATEVPATERRKPKRRAAVAAE